MTKDLFARCLLMLAVFLVPAVGFAAGEALPPDELVRSVTNEVLTIVRSDKSIQAGNTRKVLDLVDQKVLPHFNFNRMASSAVGFDWRTANPEQRERITAAFRTLLVRTYSNALTQYRNQEITVRPLRSSPGEKRVRVNTVVSQPGAQPISIDYALEQEGQAWKVFDVIVAGVSLVTNYRSSFVEEIHAKGIEGLIASLEAKNKSLETGQGSK